MTVEAIIVSIALITMFFTLIKEYFPPDLTVFMTLAAITLFGILTPEEAVKGFSNSSVHTVALLFIIGSAAYNSGILHHFVTKLLNSSKNLNWVLTKLMTPIFFLSAFINNTPIVVMLTPTIRNWAIKQKLSPSKLLIPLSYAAILGGTITLIGTSTNLVVHGLLQQKGLEGFTMFEFMYIGIPLSIIGLLYMILYGQYQLPDRKDMINSFQESSKKYIFEFIVPTDSILVGKSITEAKLRNLHDLFLIQILRGNQIISPAPNYEIIQPKDRLIFSGNAKSMIALENIKGLKLWAEEDELPTKYHKGNMTFIEVVISHSSPLVEKKIKDSNFRAKYNAAIVAISRNNKQIMSGIGNTKLKPGDALLLITGKDFQNRWSNSKDFYLVSNLSLEAISPHQIKVVFTVLIGIISLISFGILPIFKAALLGVLTLIVTKSIQPSELRKAIDWSVLILMASSIGIGTAVEKTGLAEIVASLITSLGVTFGLFGIAFLIYFITSILTEMINNLASAAFMFPIGFSVSETVGYDPKLLAIIIAVSASCSFITPIGYQTNLIVYGPGGYRFSDYIKVGLPLSILCMITTVWIASALWG
ncbi:MAG: SLC13 family permease [Bacillota bacterium]